MEATREQSFADVAEVMALLRAAPEAFPIAGEFDLADVAAAVELPETSGREGAVILRAGLDSTD
ncbi:hypothetical protein ABZZ36_31565 [Actinacidiphila glaucinigra]|uniref:hypothetical protein n=1 Tax=Actinacidiphila glaucinigra TaxID=235986 RepID=UPI0033A9AD15